MIDINNIITKRLNLDDERDILVAKAAIGFYFDAFLQEVNKDSDYIPILKLIKEEADNLENLANQIIEENPL